MTDELEPVNRSTICKDDCVFCPRLQTCIYICEPGVCPIDDAEDEEL